MNQDLQNIHIIAIGGAVMSSLAVALKEQGKNITGSDDKIYDPSKSHLIKHGLLPKKEGWQDSKITSDLDAVILGMHAKADNPELLRAKELDIPIFSYPEFIRLQCNNKQRIVITGSHGKTTITGIIIHVLKELNKSFDYLIGAKINGIDNTIKITEAPVIIIEGDEYFTSPIDPAPKFLKYDHHIALITGTAWDHVNVYPTLESYIAQFEELADQTPKAGTLIFSEHDKMAYIIGNKDRPDVKAISYKTHDYRVEDGQYFLKSDEGNIPVKIFGKHNMQNIEGARILLSRLGITPKEFHEAIQSFSGAEKRSELISEGASTNVYCDYAHSPSKLEATVKSLKELHPKRSLTAVFELHTFSSLNKDFLPNYESKFDAADTAIVYFDKQKIAAKNYQKEIKKEDIITSFKRKDIQVYTDPIELERFLTSQDWKDTDLLMMSSGNFNELDIRTLANQVTQVN